MTGVALFAVLGISALAMTTAILMSVVFMKVSQIEQDV